MTNVLAENPADKFMEDADLLAVLNAVIRFSDPSTASDTLLNKLACRLLGDIVQLQSLENANLELTLPSLSQPAVHPSHSRSLSKCLSSGCETSSNWGSAHVDH